MKTTNQKTANTAVIDKGESRHVEEAETEEPVGSPSPSGRVNRREADIQNAGVAWIKDFAAGEDATVAVAMGVLQDTKPRVVLTGKAKRKQPQD